MDAEPVWLPIAETDGRYEVCEDGRVRVAKVDMIGRLRYIGHVLSPAIRRGYPGVTLATGDGRHINRPLHILVLEAFLGPRGPKQQCNHKDGNKGNPRRENLEWVTAKENYRHALDVLGHQPVFGEAHWSANVPDPEIVTIRERRATGTSIMDLSRELGKSPGWLSQVCTGRTRASAGGPLTRTRAA
jgi:hypothetical protein